MPSLGLTWALSAHLSNFMIDGRFPEYKLLLEHVSTKVTPPACLHIYPEDTACCLISPTNCGATSVFFRPHSLKIVGEPLGKKEKKLKWL